MTPRRGQIEHGFSREAHFEQFARLSEEMKLAGVDRDPYFQFMLDAGASPLRRGDFARRAMGIGGTMIHGRALANALSGPPPRPWPGVEPQHAVCVGRCVRTGRLVLVPLHHLTRHLLISGKTGAGKTTVLWGILQQLIRHGVEACFQDHKNEGRRLLNVFSKDILVLPVERDLVALLEPVGPPEKYYTALCCELGRAYSIRPETWTKLVTVLLRLAAGRRDHEPFPSLKDLEIVLGRTARTEGRQSLHTAALALGSVCGTLGRAARVRRGPAIDARWPVIVRECQGLPPRVLQFLSAAFLLRLQSASTAEGHSQGRLMSVYVSDEGSLEFGKELASQSASGYISPQRRLITQIRSDGRGIIVCVQTLGNTDDVLKANVGQYLCLGTQTAAETREAAQLLGLPNELAPQLQQLPLGMGFLRCDLYPEPILVSIPNFDAGSYLSDARVAERMRDAWGQLEQEAIFSEVTDDIGTPLSYSEILGETSPGSVGKEDEDNTDEELPDGDPELFGEWDAFLRDILTSPDSGVKARYDRLGWSAGRGQRVKLALVENGLITAGRSPSPQGGRPREILTVTARGKTFLEARTA